MDLWGIEGAFSTQFRQGNLHNQIVMCLCYVLFFCGGDDSEIYPDFQPPQLWTKK